MRRARSRILVFPIALGLLVGMAQISGAPPASAQGAILGGPPMCDFDDPTYCMNDWYNGGINTPVRMFTPQQTSTNENFSVIQLDDRCGGAVTSDCPFTNKSFDDEYMGDPVVEVFDNYNGYCLSANTSSATAMLGNCPVNGTGGSPGNVYVYDNVYGALVSNYYTNLDGYAACISGSDQDGASMYLYIAESSGDCNNWELNS
jgi:hypothetical protein